MNRMSVLQGASWAGNQKLATQKQLVSSIAGLYTDIQDISLSTIVVTDLTVSTINADFISSTQGGFSLVSLSTLSLKGIDLGGINLSFDLGLGNAIGGFLGGLGAAVGGAFIGIGTGVGLTIQGLETGLATLINGRGENTITNNTFETINGSTQLQISTLGDAYPLYSTIFRTVSSSSANQEPGPQIFVSSFFNPGTTCVRSVSDPLNLLTGDSNLNTSTIQSFGQWVPFLDPTQTGEDIYARDAFFSTLTLYPGFGYGITNVASNTAPDNRGIYQTVTIYPETYSYNTTSNFQTIANNPSVFNTETALVYGNQTMNFISSPYNQYTSTIGNYTGPVFFLTSSITNQSTIPKFIYNGSIFGGANFAVCEPDESGFLSTATMDFVAQSSNIFLQWGLGVDNRNSTIGFGTSKRVTWDNTANTSNFIDIPQPISTIVSNTLTTYQMKIKPLEIEIDTVAAPDNGSGSGWAGMAFRVNRATFGSGTTFNNQPNFPYQFNNNVFVNGILEADTLVAISSIVNVSTNIQTFFSTQTFDADEATISSLTVTSLINAVSSAATVGFISSLRCNEIIAPTGNISSLQTNFISSGNAFLNNLVVNNLQTTGNVVANASINSLTVSTISPFIVANTLGNPFGTYDISRYDSVVSTSYNQVSSLTQNILNYSLNVAVQDEAIFDIGDAPPAVLYNVTPGNISQWASTIIQFSGSANVGQIDLGWVGQWGVSPGSSTGSAPGGATFDIQIVPAPGYLQNAGFYLTQESNNSYPFGISTMIYLPNNATQTRYRCTLPPIVGGSRSGWWEVTPGFTPYQTSNNNTFSISQDINDTFISATDRLHLQAGDIFMDGTLNLSNVNLTNLNLANLETSNAFVSSLYVQQANVSSFQSLTYSNILNFTGSINAPPIRNPLNFQYNLNSTDYTTIRTLTVPSRGPNLFNSQNVNEWNNTMYNQPPGTNTTTGPPVIYLGEPKLTVGYAYGPAQFWINNTTAGLSFPVQIIKSGGWLSTLGAATTTGTGYSLIETPDGLNWSITSNVPNPQGLGGYSYSNSYNLQMNEEITQLNVGMPYTEVISGTKTVTANKMMLNVNQIRTTTYSSPSYPSREAGFELSSYFDQDVVFLSGNTYSDAVNNIISPQGSLGYALNAWSPQLWFGRIRTESFGIQGEEIEAVVVSISGTFADFIWASHRYLNVVGTAGAVSANIREIYFMVPFNWFTYTNFPGPY